MTIDRGLAHLEGGKAVPWRVTTRAVVVRTNEKEYAMKLTPTQVERTLSQFEAQAIPDDHPAVPQLNELFGDIPSLSTATDLISWSRPKLLRREFRPGELSISPIGAMRI